MTTQKFTNLDKFLKMHTDITVVIIQSNKIVSNEVKDKEEPLQLQKNLNPPFGQPSRSALRAVCYSE